MTKQLGNVETGVTMRLCKLKPSPLRLQANCLQPVIRLSAACCIKETRPVEEKPDTVMCTGFDQQISKGFLQSDASGSIQQFTLIVRTEGRHW